MWLTLILKYKKTFIVLALLLAAAIWYYFWKRKSESEKALNDLTVDKANLTITNNQAIIISENLLAAMDNYGTNEQAIIDNLKTLRKDDILLVMKTFGVRPYNGAGLATRDYEKKFLSTDLNLVGWLREELDGDWLDQVENIFINAQIPF